MPTYPGRQYPFTEDGFRQLCRDLAYYMNKVDEQNVNFNSTTIVDTLSTSIAIGATSDVNRTNGVLNDISNILFKYGMASSS